MVNKHKYVLIHVAVLLYFLVTITYIFYVVFDNIITAFETFISITLCVGFIAGIVKIVNPIINAEINKQQSDVKQLEHIYPEIHKYLHQHELSTLYVSPVVYDAYFNNSTCSWYHIHKNCLFSFNVIIDSDMSKYEFGPTPKHKIETINDFYL